MEHIYTLGKSEHLKSDKAIQQLFATGNAIVAYPLRVVYQLLPQPDAAKPIQAMFVAPKKNFHHAVTRNRIKRHMREAYRLHKLPLQTALLTRGLELHIAIICIAKETPDYQRITNHLTEALTKIEETL